MVLLKLYPAARNVSPIETGMKLHALAHFEGEGGAGAVVEVSVDMTMTDGPIGIGTGIAQGAMKATLVMDEAEAADLTMIGSIAAERAVITMLLNTTIRYLPSNNSTRNLLRLHPCVTTFVFRCASNLVIS
jgi:hypothetical protein